MPLLSAAAGRYAQSLFDLAEGEGSTRETLLELTALVDLFHHNPLFAKFFRSPVIPKENKLEALESLAKSLPRTHRFLALVVERNRMGLFEDMVPAFQRLHESLEGEMSVDVTSARKLSAQMLDEISDLLQSRWGKKIRVIAHEDASLLGGFIARGPGRIFDASVRTQLESLERQVLTEERG